MGERSPREKATVLMGRCPGCDDFPDGEWSDGSEWKHWCGLYIVAVATYDKDGALHWHFDKAFDDDAAPPPECPSKEEP